MQIAPVVRRDTRTIQRITPNPKRVTNSSIGSVRHPPLDGRCEKQSDSADGAYEVQVLARAIQLAWSILRNMFKRPATWGELCQIYANLNEFVFQAANAPDRKIDFSYNPRVSG